jgi:hypothetical protein
MAIDISLAGLQLLVLLVQSRAASADSILPANFAFWMWQGCKSTVALPRYLFVDGFFPQRLSTTGGSISTEEKYGRDGRARKRVQAMYGVSTAHQLAILIYNNLIRSANNCDRPFIVLGNERGASCDE